MTLGYTTNGPAIFQLRRLELTNPVVIPAWWTNPTLKKLGQQMVGTVHAYTNSVFERFQPDSLNYLVWTNLLARTNGRSTSIWRERVHPAGWPTNPPAVRWNPDSLLYGWRGWTAISPCWEGEVSSGQVPITALTRRHGYSRGHGMGADGFSANFAGKKVWFVTAKDQLITVKILRQVVRVGGTDAQTRRDYTIFLFDRDLPAEIEPLSVTALTNLSAKYAFIQGAPTPILKTEQGGHVSAEISGFAVPTWKGGDSGSPDMLPLPGELIFVGGRSTTGPTPAMQADMDELCRLEKLDPKLYQMRWKDLSRFPYYVVQRR